MAINKKINVCHLISGDLWAGAEVQVYGLLCSLKSVPDLRLSAIVLNEGKLSAALRKSGTEVIVIEESKYGFFKILRLISHELKDKDIDILHTHRYKENVLGSLLKRKCSVKRFVQTVHGIGEPFKGIKNLKMRSYAFMEQYLRRKYADRVLTVSYDIKQKLIGKMDEVKIVAIHNAIDPAHLKLQKKPAEIKNELNIDIHQPVIGSAGRMVPVKGYENFLKAAGIIVKAQKAKFVLVGDGPLRPRLEKTVREMDLEKDVIFLGFRYDIIDILNCLDIFVLSSYYEGIPIALLEAMALEKSVVATDVGGINEIIEDNVSGLLVRRGDAPALASACMRLLEDQELRRSLGKEARKRVEDEFSIDVHRKRVLNLYHEVIGKK